MDVSIEHSKPMVSVRAKPFTEPEPRPKRMRATMSVVTLASTMSVFKISLVITNLDF